MRRVTLLAAAFLVAPLFADEQPNREDSADPAITKRILVEFAEIRLSVIDQIEREIESKQPSNGGFLMLDAKQLAQRRESLRQHKENMIMTAPVILSKKKDGSEFAWGRFASAVKVESVSPKSVVVEMEREARTLGGGKKKERIRFQVIGVSAMDWKQGEKRTLKGLFTVVKTLPDDSLSLRPVPIDQEALANETLQLAKRELPGNKKAAVRKLKHVGTFFPKTEAAEEARKLLSSP